MGNKPTTATVGTSVDGLTEAVKAMGKFSKAAGNEARSVMRVGAREIATLSKRRVGRRPGGGSYPRRSGMIGYSATGKGAAVKLKGANPRYPMAWGAEYGAKRAWVFGRVTTQGKLRRRQYPVWRGNQFVTRGRSGPGWIIQPTIRENMDRVVADIADGLDLLLNAEMNKAGVPRSGRRGR